MDKADKQNAEDVAMWLARETGHVPEGDEGYEAEGTEEGPRKIGLPQDKHERLRRFFDGMHVEKALQEDRRMRALEDVDNAEMMNQTLKGMVPGETPPGGGY